MLGFVFLPQGSTYLDIWSMGTMCILLLLVGVIFKMFMLLVDDAVNSSKRSLIFCLVILSRNEKERNAEVLRHARRLASLSFQCRHFLLPIFCSSVVRYVHILDFYLFLLGWLLFDHIRSLSLIVFFTLKSALFNINIVNSCSGGQHGNPLQYSCLDNPMDREACQATVQSVAKSRTWLKKLSTYV